MALLMNCSQLAKEIDRIDSRYRKMDSFFFLHRKQKTPKTTLRNRTATKYPRN
jgi:hypothetical protein